MKLFIEPFKSRIRETYQNENLKHAHYWNEGYIECLRSYSKLSRKATARLTAYNDNIYLESAKKGREEPKKMDLERIGKRINESIQKHRTIILPMNVSLTAEMTDVVCEGRKALEIYKELIVKIYDIAEDGAPFRTRRIGECIQELEEKYYPQPKTTKEKINGIINKHATSLDRDAIFKDLIKLRDEIED